MLFRTLFCSKTPYVKIPPSSVTPNFLTDWAEFFCEASLGYRKLV